jgi:hypothetical protein
MHCLPIVTNDRIPETGRLRQKTAADDADYDEHDAEVRWGRSSEGRNDTSARETFALLLETQNQLSLFRELYAQQSVATRSTANVEAGSRANLVRGDIEGSWNKTGRKGIFTIRLYITRAALTSYTRNSGQSLSKLLSVW